MRMLARPFYFLPCKRGELQSERDKDQRERAFFQMEELYVGLEKGN